MPINSTKIHEPPHDKTNKMICALSEDSDQPGHPPSLIRVFAVGMKKPWVFSYPMSASEDSDQTGRMSRLIFQAGRTCHFVGSVMKRLTLCLVVTWVVRHHFGTVCCVLSCRPPILHQVLLWMELREPRPAHTISQLGETSKVKNC